MDIEHYFEGIPVLGREIADCQAKDEFARRWTATEQKAHAEMERKLRDILDCYKSCSKGGSEQKKFEHFFRCVLQVEDPSDDTICRAAVAWVMYTSFKQYGLVWMTVFTSADEILRLKSRHFCISLGLGLERWQNEKEEASKQKPLAAVEVTEESNVLQLHKFRKK